MKKYIPIILINLFLAIIQTSFTLELFGAHLNPNFILALSFTFIIANNTERSLFSSLIGGLFFDLLSTSTVGVSSLTLCILVLISAYVRNYIFKGWFSYSLVLIISAIFYQGVIYAQFPLNLQALLGALMTLIVSFLIFGLVDRYSGLVEKSEYKIKSQL